ncbi:hypothetical protein Tco_0098124 [Tanacetum coccineum]
MASHRSKSLYAIKECSTCGSLYTKDCCSIGSLNDKILTPVPSPRCARCGTPVDGPSCRGCAFLRKKFDEDLLAYCVENGIFKDFQDTSESSDDNTNVVNALREPCVVNQDPGVKSSQDPPQIDHNCCYECGDSLDGIFCQQCICKSCGKGAHYGYNCPPKDPIISKPEPCNQTINEIPQTLPSLDPSCYSLPHVSKPNFVDNSPNFSYPPPQLQFETYLCELCGNNAHYGYELIHTSSRLFREEKIDEEYERECEIRIRKLKQDFNIRGSEVQKKEKAYEDEKYVAALFVHAYLLLGDYDGYEVIKSSVENLAPIPIEFEADFDPNDDTSSDNDDFEDIEYVSLEGRENNIEPDQEGLISIDNSNNTLLELPEFESFHFDPSFPRPPPEPPDVEICLHFEPDAPVIDNFNELNDDQRGSEIDFSQNVKDDDSFTFVIRTFLPFLTYPEVSPLSCSTGSEDTIFDPDIFT